jgi:hypothetical protein
MSVIPPEVASAFPLPWRVAVNPYGRVAGDDEDNIFVISADGSNVLVVARHPVWRFMREARLALAQHVVDLANGPQPPPS